MIETLSTYILASALISWIEENAPVLILTAIFLCGMMFSVIRNERKE